VTLVLATGGSDCERISEALLAQPVNTLSSFAYVAVGAWIALRAGGAAGRIFGGLVALTGVGSIAYHGWDGPGVGLAHDLTIVAVAVFIVGFEVTHRRAKRRAAGYVVAAAALAVGLAANLLGRTGAPLCAPESVVQWHAFWHVATAVALGAWAWAAVHAQEGEGARWEGSTAELRSSPGPARESVEA
jgi:hypothetical protein